jgi:hypothetical protein
VVVGKELLDVGQVCHRPPGRDRDAEGAEPFPHGTFVLRVPQRVGAGMDDDALGGQRPDVLARYVLVVEGDHVAAFGEAQQGVEVGVVADDGVGDNQSRAIVGYRRQDASDWPSAIAVIRASRLPPTMPTIGRPVREPSLSA